MLSHAGDPRYSDHPNFRYIDPWSRDLTAMADEYDPHRRLRPLHDYRTQIIDDMHRAGIGILAGSDTPGGFTLHQELQLFVESGMTPLEALRTATVNPARYLGRESELGSIATQRIADLVLLRANPLRDIRNLKTIEAVVFQGNVLERAQLDRILEQLEQDAADWPE